MQYKFILILSLIFFSWTSATSQTCTSCFTAIADSTNPSLINLDPSCSNASASATYEWYVDGIPLFITNQIAFQLPFYNAGTYNIELLVSDGTCSDTSSQQVVISPVCNATFLTYNVSSSGFYFNAAWYNSPTATYTWDFGDSTSATGTTAFHNYTSVGNYNVCLTVTDSSCNDTQCQNVSVTSVATSGSCIASFSTYVDTLIGILNADASTSSFDPTNTIFTWLLNGSIVQQSTSSYYSNILPSTGTYTLTLILSDLSLTPCDSSTQTIIYNNTIFGFPTCYSCFNYSYNATYDSVYLNSCSQIASGGSLLWYVNGTTFTNSNSTFLQGFNTYGLQQIGLYVLDSLGNICDSSFQSIYTYSPPCSSCLTVTQVTGSTSDYIFDGSCSSLNYAYNWYVNGNYVLTSFSPQFNYSFNQSGTYNVCVESMDQLGSYCSQNCTTVVVTTPPSSSFILSGRIYKFDSLYNYVPTSNNEAKVYLIKLITGGTLEVIDSTVTNSFGYYSFNNKPIDDYRVKVALETSSPNYSINIPTYYTSSFMWYDAQVITLFGNTYNRDIYMQYGTNTGGPGFISGNVFLGANKNPKTRNSEASDATIILINIATNETIAYAKPNASGDYSFNNIPNGSYKLVGELLNRATIPDTVVISNSQSTFTNKNFVYNNSIIQPTTNALSLNETSQLSTLSISPNPANTFVELYCNDFNRNILITDITGKRIDSFKLIKGKKKTINCSEWSNGIYVILSEAEGRKSVQKLLVN